MSKPIVHHLNRISHRDRTLKKMRHGGYSKK
jgi:hypothetical protein